MFEQAQTYQLPLSNATIESSARVMHELHVGSFEEHFLTNDAEPFVKKQPIYLAAYQRSLYSRNHRYILDCKGEES